MSEEANYIYTGEVVHKGQPETFGTFTKAVLVVRSEDSRYPQEVQFEVSGKALEYMSGYDVGDRVTVKFDLRGRKGEGKWEGRWFTNLTAWRVDKLEGGQAAEAAQQDNGVADEPEAGMPF